MIKANEPTIKAIPEKNLSILMNGRMNRIKIIQNKNNASEMITAYEDKIQIEKILKTEMSCNHLRYTSAHNNFVFPNGLM